ncbi:MAG: tetratricopeptide repeat protein [Pyrinomonadaceae bacterium]
MIFSLILLLSLAGQPFAVQNFFAITGSVRDDQGHAVSSIRVTLDDEDSHTIETVFADSSGRFQFRRLRAGNYYVRVETTGTPYENQSVFVPLQSMSNSNINPSSYEDTTPVDITLKRKMTRSGTPAVVFVQEVPPTAREEFQRGAATINGKDPEAAIASLKKAIEIFPEYFDALDLLGTQYVKLRQFENAEPILTRAVAINQKSGSSMYWLGISYLESKRYQESIEWLTSALGQDSGNPYVHLKLGEAYGKSGSLDQAETALKKAYQLGGSEVAEAHFLLGFIYYNRKKFTDAAREWELYLKEARNLKDKAPIKELIAKAKVKENETK